MTARRSRTEAVGSRQGAVRGAQQATAPVFTLWLPMLPPSANHMWVAVPRSRKGGGRYMGRELSAEAQAFRLQVLQDARAKATDEGFVVPDGPLCIELRLMFGTKRRQDGDNRQKAAVDALAIALGFDDSRVVEWHGYVLGVDAKQSACEITLRAVQS